MNQGLSFVDANSDKANKMHPHVEDIMCFGCWYAVVLSREWANTVLEGLSCGVLLQP